MRPCTLLLVVLALSAAVDAAPLPGDPVALGPEVVVNQALTNQQEWGKVVMDRYGTRFAVAFNSVGGEQIFVRLYDIDGTPTTNAIELNPTPSSGIQDEPMAAMDAAGNVLVCWSDRGDHDGGAAGSGASMGCFGRIVDATGTPLGPEFQINEVAFHSQWEPHPSALPGGGWVISFNGSDDGDAYLRFFDTDGTPRTGDIFVNTWEAGGQTEAEHAVLADGRVLAVYADFGGQVGGGTGTNLFARLFDGDGIALQRDEFLVNDGLLAFDQLEPRMAAAGIDFGFGHFVLVWEDWGNDGDSAGIYGRIYDEDAAAVGAEFAVNTTTTGMQRLPEVACDHLGNFIVAWEDWSTGSGRIVARHFDLLGNPLTDEFLVSGGAVGNYRRPTVAMDQSGQEVVFAYSGPGTGEDVYVRRFQLPTIAIDGNVAIGQTFELDLALPSGDGLWYAIVAGFDTNVGIPFPDGRKLPVNLDQLFKLSFKFANTGFPFQGFQGLLMPDGSTTGAVVLPGNPNLIGVPMNFAAFTLDLGFASLKFQVRHMTKSVGAVIQ